MSWIASSGRAAPFEPRAGNATYLAGIFTRIAEAAKIDLRSIAAHRLRRSLTLFGIVVGILAVISVVALGEGGRRIVLDQINSLRANSISIPPGKGWDDPTAEADWTKDPAAAARCGFLVEGAATIALPDVALFARAADFVGRASSAAGGALSHPMIAS
jgi:hypothetical protein